MTYSKPLSSQDKMRLETLYSNLSIATDTFAGYPCNTDFDYSELFKFFRFAINNIGDPREYSNYKVNTHEFETEALSFFASLLKAGPKWRGYIGNGGTEGNMFGIDLGLQRFPKAMLYFSDRTHYSIRKIARLLRAEFTELPTLVNGEIDYNAFEIALSKHKDRAAVINVNIGTTMTGAVDNLTNIQQALCNQNIEQFHLHGDAALSGMILPFVNHPQAYNFKDGIHSIAISGHKFIGSPLPCGIAMTNQETPMSNQPTVAYVKITDNTIASSRNGISPLFMWYAIKRYGYDGFKQMIDKCMALTDYTIQRLIESGIPAWKNKNSITVVFPRPSEELIQHWQLAPHKDIAHMVVMPHFTKALIDEVTDSLVAEMA